MIYNPTCWSSYTFFTHKTLRALISWCSFWSLWSSCTFRSHSSVHAINTRITLRNTFPFFNIIKGSLKYTTKSTPIKINSVAYFYIRYFSSLRMNTKRGVSPFNRSSCTERCVKSVLIWSFSDPCFPAFGLNTDIYRAISVFSRNAGKYGPEKLWIRTIFIQ